MAYLRAFPHRASPMNEPLRATIHPVDADWPSYINRLRASLGAPRSPYLFPPHFLKVAFPKIGGAIIAFERYGVTVGVGFLFPRGVRDGAREYTLRFHSIGGAEVESAEVVRVTEECVPGSSVVYYDPAAPQQYTRTETLVSGISVGRPGEGEAAAIRELQRQTWDAQPDNLYPSDIHSTGFGLATSLVARVDGNIAGFCFGFYKLGGPSLPGDWQERFGGDLRIESQVLATAAEYRGRGIGAILKRAQAERALAEGIGIINWTVDPLQYANARLNYNSLGAFAFDFFPDYYPDFRNGLNQLAASRFGITWLPATQRANSAPHSTLSADASRLNPLTGEDTPLARGYDTVAVEIPPKWDALQRGDPAEAQRWREATDSLFGRYVGWHDGQYVVTAAAEADARPYLLLRRAGESLLRELGAME